jgi:hypothetical protein
MVAYVAVVLSLIRVLGFRRSVRAFPKQFTLFGTDPSIQSRSCWWFALIDITMCPVAQRKETQHCLDNLIATLGRRCQEHGILVGGFFKKLDDCLILCARTIARDLGKEKARHASGGWVADGR